MLDVTMQQVADTLGLGLPLSVFDKTGLTGHYDLVFGFAVDQLPQTLAHPMTKSVFHRFPSRSKSSSV
jgi:uncharacterized protein (TIGR03435 family)